MRLILFFNGWGMNEKVVEGIDIPEGYELKIINFPYEVNLELTKYEKVIAVGWSFGCYYLSKFIKTTDRKFEKVVGINGNGEIIGKYGITPKIFEFTLVTLTPESLLKFYKNMEIDRGFKNPEKDFEMVKEELQYFKDNYQELDNIFDEIIIGERDKIVPAMRQKKYCEEKNIGYRVFDTGHYPFNYIKSWSEII